jgi:anaerobic selenocysteine-containing dehydrogenase
MRTAHKTCNLCEAMCGLVLGVEDGRVVSVRGDKDDPLSRGYICPKAYTLKEIQEDPDRLRHPVRRTRGGAWERVSWDSALAETAEEIARIQERHGRHAVATYVGNPSVHAYGTVLYGFALLKAIGGRNRFSASSVDQNPRHAASILLYGSALALPVPDIDRTRHLLILGANPVVSNGSLMSAPDVKRRLQAIRAAGGRVLVVDPRRTETAKVAGEHVFIRPGTDAALLASLVHVVLEEGLGRAGPLEARVEGRAALRAALADLAPERTAAFTGIDAASVRRMAREFAAAPSAVCYGRLGTCLSEHGTLASWLCDALNIVTGNLDRPGGAMFPTPAADLLPLARKLGISRMGRFKSRVRGLPEFGGELPVATLADEILTPGEGQVRGLVTIAGNPVLSTPNGRRLDGAIAGLDFFAAIDIYVNETTRHARVILPTTWTLEHDEYEIVFRALGIRDTARFSRAVIEPPPDARHDWQVISELALRLVERKAKGLPARLAAAAARRAGAVPSPRALLDLMIRTGSRGDRFLPWSEGLNLAKIEAHPSGVDLGPLAPRLEAILEEGWRIDLGHARIREEIAHLRGRVEGAGAGPRPLALIGRRDLRTNNSWGHNARSLVKDGERCDLLMHPRDAAARGLADGERVRVEGRVGAVETRLRVSDEVAEGVVSMPHGWGHDRAEARLSVARTAPGASVNDVTDEARLERVTGTCALNGVPVEVSRAAGRASVASQELVA